MKKITYEEAICGLQDAHDAGREQDAVVVFKADGFLPQYENDTAARSYRISSNANYFNAKKSGVSIYGECLDGSGECIEIRCVMLDGWEPDYCYFI